MGPLAGRRIDVMDGLVQDVVTRRNLLRGGSRLNREGSFYAPTVLDNVGDDARIMNDEPFGPVAPIDSFATVDELWPVPIACHLDWQPMLLPDQPLSRV